MEHHYNLLRNLGIDPESEHNLWFIPNDKYRAPATGQFSEQNIANKQIYQSIVDTFMQKHLFSYEYDKVINGFERSQISIEALYDDTYKANQPRVRLQYDKNFMDSFHDIQDAFRPPKPVHILHFADTRLYPWPLRTNIELPYSQSHKVEKYLETRFQAGEIPDRKPCLHNLYNYVFNEVRTKVHKIKEGLCFTGNLEEDFLYPMTAHVRPGLGKRVHGNFKIKNRLVYGVSKVQVIPASQFGFPLFRVYQETGLSPLLWQYETINGGWMKLRNEYASMLHLTFFIFSGDWTQFDHRVLFELISLIWMNDISYYNWEEYQPTEDYSHAPFDKQRLLNLYVWLLYSMLSSPLLMPDGKLIMRVFAALASGMFHTQYMDSKINGVMLLTIFRDAGFEIDAKRFLKLLGDDNFAMIFRYLPPSQIQPLFDFLSERAMIRFGAVLSVDASEFHDSLDFVELLGYRNFCGHAYRDPLKLLAQLYYPETQQWTLSTLKARCVGIIYANLHRDPRLIRVCTDIFNYLDSQGIGFSKKALLNMFDPNTRHYLNLVEERLPTQLEVQQYLCIPKPRTSADNERYWPTAFFIEPDDYERRLCASMRRFRFSYENKI